MIDEGRRASGFPCPFCGRGGDTGWVYIEDFEGTVMNLYCPDDGMRWPVDTHFTHAERTR